MKIHFGNYPKGNYRSKLLDLYKGQFMPDALTPFERFLEKTDDVLQTVLNATVNPIWGHRKRKLKVRIDDYDVWGAHHTLAMVIHPVLVRLKEKKKGAPYTDNSDVPKHLRSTAYPKKKTKYDTDGGHFLRWDWILNEMIWAFEQESNEDADDQFFVGGSYDKEKAIAWQARKSNGRRLFGKYYDNLWD